LRSLLALYPYFQSARLLLLQNLYLLHDPTFDEELRRAAIYISDRKVIFQMIEAGHYKLVPRKKEKTQDKGAELMQGDSRTLSLIDDFLDSLPRDEELKDSEKRRRPTPADAALDYVAYLLESESEEEEIRRAEETPKLRGQNLIDDFIEGDNGRIVLSENPTLKPELEPVEQDEQKDSADSVNTETMSRIYIKQGNYSKALQIIRQLSLANPKKNAYFADQIRFLEKLIINNNKKNR